MLKRDKVIKGTSFTVGFQGGFWLFSDIIFYMILRWNFVFGSTGNGKVVKNKQFPWVPNCPSFFSQSSHLSFTHFQLYFAPESLAVHPQRFLCKLQSSQIYIISIKRIIFFIPKRSVCWKARIIDNTWRGQF